MISSKRANVSRHAQVVVILVTIILGASGAYASSTIEGTVYDDRGSTVADVFVELLNEVGSALGTTRTDGIGRYMFSGLSDGTYTVRVKPLQYDFLEQQRRVSVATITARGGEGSGYFQADFRLIPRRTGFTDRELGVVFVQEVPSSARKEFENATALIRSEKRQEGFAALQRALDIFPNYFDALFSSGTEFFASKMYKEATTYFLKASQVNSNSITTLFYLGLSLHHMDKAYDKAALTALTKAKTMAPTSAQVLYGLGVIQRSMGDLVNAEKTLLEAKKQARSDVPEIHQELAQLYGNDLKRYDAAAAELELFIKSADGSKEDVRATRKIIASLREKARAKTTP